MPLYMLYQKETGIILKRVNYGWNSHAALKWFLITIMIDKTEQFGNVSSFCDQKEQI